MKEMKPNGYLVKYETTGYDQEVNYVATKFLEKICDDILPDEIYYDSTKVKLIIPIHKFDALNKKEIEVLMDENFIDRLKKQRKSLDDQIKQRER